MCCEAVVYALSSVCFDSCHGLNGVASIIGLGSFKASSPSLSVRAVTGKEHSGESGESSLSGGDSEDGMI